MRRSRFANLILFMFLVILLTGCADIKREAEKVIGQVDPNVIQDVQDYAQEQGVDLNVTATRAQIISRALVWVTDGVVYGSYDNDPKNDYHDGYRTDCSGFVSYAWGLKNGDGQPISASTKTLGNTYGTDISLEDIQPGDILSGAGITGGE